MLANRIDTIVYLGVPQTRSVKTTNLDRIAADLLDDVMQGLLSVHKAATHYGSWATRTNGRSRRFPSFADHIDYRARGAGGRAGIARSADDAWAEGRPGHAGIPHGAPE